MATGCTVGRADGSSLVHCPEYTSVFSTNAEEEETRCSPLCREVPQAHDNATRITAVLLGSLPVSGGRPLSATCTSR